MNLKWLTLLTIELLFLQFTIPVHGEICRESVVKREPCRNGTRNVRITTYVRENGVCTPFPTITNVHCEIEKKNFCKCSAVGDPHYRTYDGQVIHFYGDCRYTLTKYHRRHDPCSFNIEVENEYRGKNKFFTYTKSVIVHMFGNSYELGQRKTLKVNGIVQPLPFLAHSNARIFRYRRFLLFIVPRCSIKVAFDGDSNAFVKVPKRFSNKMKGICGNCNGIQDDFKTRSGRDVSNKKNKYVLIGNSYNVSTPTRQCKPAPEVTYEDFCGKEWIERVKAKRFCGSLLSRNNPFRKCAGKGHVSMKNFYDDCLIDMCVNRNRPHRLEKVRCEILSGIAEVCSQAGFGGIKWRAAFKCPMRCGNNQYFTEKATSCPRTCENYFYGTKSPCYDLPYREGCECKKGFLRDGAMCVKPMHCKCISLCVDRESSEKCKFWKMKGHCTEFREQMNMLCPRSCGLCRSRSGHCEDELSRTKCLHFRRKGLCIHEFYRTLCGLTCNFDKCRCERGRSVVGKCNRLTNIRKTTHYKFARDSNGRCAKIITQTRQICDCEGVITSRGRCNLCTGKRKIIRHIKEIVKKKCIRRKHVIYENCRKCLKKRRVCKRCLGHKLVKTTISFNKLNGCFRCVRARRVVVRQVICKSKKKVFLNKVTCLKHTRLIIRKAVNCKCDTDIKRHTSVWCCNKKSKILKPICRRRRLFHRTISFKFQNRRCVPVYKDRTQRIKCGKIKRSFIKGICLRSRKGKFHCKAIDITRKRFVGKDCKCKIRIIKSSRTCCCRKPHNYKTCNRARGIKTFVTVRYVLVVRRSKHICLRIVKKTLKVIDSKTKFRIIRGKCQRNCLRRDKILKTFRHGCKIITKVDGHHLRLCCCKPMIWRETKCLADYLVTFRYKKVIRNRRCVDVLQLKTRKDITCPRRTVSKSKCVYPGHKRQVTTVFYHLHNCKCRRREIRTLEKCPPCPYKELQVIKGVCNKQTCLRNIYTIFVNRKCRKSTKTCYKICCCRFGRFKTSFCNRSNGIRYVFSKWLQFNKRLEKCVPRSKRTAIRVICKKPRTIKRKCDQDRKHFVKIIRIVQKLNRCCCKCKSRKIIIWKRCRCSARKITSKKCRGRYFKIREISFRLSKCKTRCNRVVKVRQDNVVCILGIRKRTQRVTNCLYKDITEFYRTIRCKCRLQRIVKLFYRCCDKKTTTRKRCLNQNRVETVTKRYRVSFDKRKCIKYIRRRTIRIRCKRYVVKKNTKCIRGKYWRIIKFNKVSNCKCVLSHRKKIRRICQCIPAFTTKRVCVGKSLQTIITRYTLFRRRNRCIASVTITGLCTKCARPLEIHGKCDHHRGFTFVKKVFWIVVNCKCVRKTLRYKKSCKCIRKDRIRRRSCKKNRKRAVEILRFVNVKLGCKWIIVKTFWEHCSCPKKRIVTRCVRHSIYRTTTTTYKRRSITNEIPLYRCIKFQRVKHRSVVCKQKYSEKRCLRHKLFETICTYEKINCKCRKVCRRRIKRSCNCKVFNKCKKACIKNIKYSICSRFRPGLKKCIEDQTRVAIRQKCPKDKTECEIRPLLRNHGYFKKCYKIYSGYRDCSCKEDVNVELQLLHCVKRKTSVRRCISNRMVIITTRYIRRYSRCIARKSQHFVRINCPRSRITIKEGKCFTQYTLVHHVIRRCKCVRKVLVRRNVKLCKRERIVKKCARNHWVYIRTSFKLKYKKVSLFPEVRRKKIWVSYLQALRTKWTKHIHCQSSYKIVTCNPKTRRLKIRRYYYVISKCRCHRKLAISIHNCVKCPKTKVIRSKCGPRNQKGRRYYDVTIIKWKILKTNKCKKFIRKRKEICQCEKTRKFKECKKGKRVYTTIWHDIYSKPYCKPTVKKQYKSIHCYNKGRKNKWVLVRKSCCRHHGQFSIKYFVRFNFDSRRCICRKVFKSVKTKICCRPCKYSKKCKNTYFLENLTCHTSKNLKCHKTSRIRKLKIVCARPRRLLVGGCRGKSITYRVIRHHIKNCRCVQKSRTYSIRKKKNVRHCIKNMIRVTHYRYVVVGNRCVERAPQFHFIRKVCKTLRLKYEDKKINACKFQRLYYIAVSVNCKCVRRIFRRRILNYKCCQKQISRKVCVKHTEIVRTRIHYRLLDFRCFPVKNVNRRRVSCRFRRPRRISTGPCTYKVLHFAVFAKNCKCHSKVVSIKRKENCCRHKKSFNKFKCDRKRGKKIYIRVSYRHTRRDTCVRIKKVRSVCVNCHRIKCTKTESPCILNTSTLKLFCYQRRGCKCVRVKTKEIKQCCGTRFRWTKIGKPGVPRKCFRLIQYFALSFNKLANHCFKKLIREQYIRICCPKSFVKRKCFGHIYHKVIRTSFLLRGQNCVAIKRQNLVLVSKCAKKSTRLVYKFCNRKTGWGERKFVTTYPKNCKCHRKSFSKKRICDCHVAYPPTKRIYCKKHKTIVTERRISHCSKRSVFWKVLLKLTRILHCKKTVIETGKCFCKNDGYATRVRYETHVRYFVKNCRCQRKVIKKVLKHCNCRKFHQQRRCQGSNRLIIISSYFVRRGRCQKKIDTVTRKVPCRTKPIIKISKCRRNKYVISRKTFYLRHCRCHSFIKRKTCDCKCPRNSVIQTCSRNYFNRVIITTYQRKNCRCYRSRSIKQVFPICPKFIRQTKGPCLSKKFGGFQEIITRRLRRNRVSCKCEVAQSRRHRICKCNLNVQHRRKCVNNNHKIHEIWGWRINKVLNRCVRYMKNFVGKSVKCRPPRSIRVCIKNKAIGKRVTIRYHLRNCKCIKHRTVKRIDCKCQGNKQLIVKGKCSGYPSCRRVDKYKHQILRGDYCRSIFTKRVEICCCPRGRKFKICQRKSIIHVNIKHKLRNNLCFKEKVKVSKAVKCKLTRARIIGACKTNGFKLITYYGVRIRNCKCLRVKIAVKRCRCRCRKKRVVVRCNNNLRFLQKTTTKYHISRCKCHARRFVKRKSIPCPKNVTIKSNCIPVKGKGYSLITTTKIKYRVNQKCKCVSRTFKSYKICRCKQKKKVKISCCSKTHRRIFKTSFTILKRGQCVRLTRTKTVPIRCKRIWRLKGDSGCRPHGFYAIRVLTFAKHINFRCQCKEVTKTTSCHCACSGPRSLRRCVRERIHHLTYLYKIIKCKCQRFVASERFIRIKCRRLPTRSSKCRIEKNRCVRYVVYHDAYTVNCKCHRRRRVVRKGCRLCRRASFHTKRCNRKTNVIKKRYVRYETLPNGYFKRFIKVSIQKVSCCPIKNCRQITNCNKKTLTQRFLCIDHYKRNCKCVRRSSRETRLCACRPKYFKKGPCHKKTCVRYITTIKPQLVVLKNGKRVCHEDKSVRKERCCCRKVDKTVVRCISNRLIRKIKRYRFNRKFKTCDVLRNRFDITPICRPSLFKISAKCNRKTCTRRIQLIYKSLVGCRCTTRRVVKVRRCCCLRKNYTAVQCRGERFVVLNHRFTFKKGKCHKHVNMKSRLVRCKKSRTKRFRCNLFTRKRVVRRYFHLLKKCRCIPKVVDKQETCSCLPNRISRKCLRRKGIIRTTSVSYRFDRKRKRCIKSVRVKLLHIKCSRLRSRVCRKCCRRHHKAVYRRCTTHWKQRSGCLCVKRWRRKFSLCRCSKTKSHKICIKNRRMTRTIYYVKAKSTDKKHDFRCVRKIKLTPRGKIFCRKPSLVVGACIKSYKIYRQKYYIRRFCRCVLKIKIKRVRCKCPRPKEVSRQCNNDDTIKKTIRSYVLSCDKRAIPNCRCVSVDNVVDKTVKCPDDQFKSNCINRRLIRSWTTYMVVNCVCKAQTQNDVSPDCKVTECKDLLPKSKCHRIKRFGICNKKNIYLKYLCPLTCKYCEKCKRSVIKKYLTQCRCRIFAEKKICSRALKITQYVPSGRKCRKVIRTVELLCNCSNKYPNKFCRNAFRTGQCSKAKVRKNCAYHCNPKCQHCDVGEVFKKCVQQGPHKGKFQVLRLKYIKFHNSVIFVKHVAFEGKCRICDTNQIKHVSKCFAGKRIVTTRYVEKRAGGSCVNKKKRQVFSCKDCCKNVKTRISTCNKGTRVVTTVFWVSIKGYCRKQTITNIYYCNARCSGVKITKTKCIYNKRLVVKKWFSDSICAPHYFYQVKDCCQ